MFKTYTKKKVQYLKDKKELRDPLDWHSVDYRSESLFFPCSNKEDVQFITENSHGITLLGFECSGKIYYQPLCNRHPERKDHFERWKHG